MKRTFVIGTRGSALAMCQSRIVQTILEERFAGLTFTLQTITAQADRNPELPLTAMGGEGVFVKELETALHEERIDLAVHSLKDLPLDVPPALRIAAVLEREEPRDALVSKTGQGFAALPRGSRVGTSSPRRRSQLLHRRGDVEMVDIRGNVDTRLRKLDEGQYDALVVAACGLIRLGLDDRIAERLDFSVMLPEPGQGALAVETRTDDADMNDMLRVLDDATTRVCIEAERAFLRALGGGCRVPIAAYASRVGQMLELEGAVVAPDGHAQVRGQLSGSMDDPRALGDRLANQLISQGARELLSSL